MPDPPSQTMTLVELYPHPGTERSLRGLHLGQDVRTRVGTDESYLYAGFIASLDGRIALAGRSGAPEAIRNDRDWRLFQELMMQADVVLTSGRYVRDAAGGTAQGLVPDPEDPDAADLVEFRTSRGLSPRPAVAVVTGSGAFDGAFAAGLSDEVIVIAGTKPDAATVARFDDVGVSVISAGRNGVVDAGLLLETLATMGHRVVFSAAGPRLFHTLVPVIDALYLTIAGRLLGGGSYATLLEGPELEVPPTFALATAYLDGHGPDGASQIFLELLRRRSQPAAGSAPT